MSETKKKGYLTGKEIRAIAKENAKQIKKLEAYKNRKAEEAEFLTEMKDDGNILENRAHGVCFIKLNFFDAIS